ncbi:MAG: HPr family phosphocarrier protein [Oceanospirillaceae bacterium]|nr:HPr family phosphocarrier protein [Oceanospirillaceae bacterium]
MPALEIRIINKLGLHARAASKLVTIASKYPCNINITKTNQDASGKSTLKIVDGKSIMSVMMLAANLGTDLLIETSGEEQDQALEAIRTLINNKFDEEE